MLLLVNDFLVHFTELKRLLVISHDHKFPGESVSMSQARRGPDSFLFVKVVSPSSFAPVIPLKSDLAVELLEKGKVRFWLQADKMTANGKVDYIFNDNAVSQGDVSEQF